MIRKCSIFLAGVLLCAASQAATINTNLSVTATVVLGATIAANGTASLSGISGANNLPFSATLTADTSGNFNAPFTITFTNGDKLNGTLTIPASVLGGGTATGKATITGGTGTYAGATGSFPSLSGSGALAGTTISLSFSGAGTINTGGSGGGPTGGPVVTAVLDAASNTPNLAPGSIFIVKGTGLSASGYTPFNPPRPTASPSGGVKVTFTPVSGGAGTDAYLWYLFNQSGVNQIAGILPSTVAPGTYNVTVTNGTASSAFLTQVVANKLALFTQDASGSGLTSLQNFINATTVDLNRLTTGTVGGVTYSPAHPGQPVIAYGTGLGAFAAADNDPSKAAHDYRADLTIKAIVGGMTINVDYAGLAGYPGEDQLNFTLPDNVPTGCAVTLQFSVNGKLTPPTAISIAPDKSSSVCVVPGYTTAQLQKLDQGGTITSGVFSIAQFQFSDPTLGSFKTNSIGGSFGQITAFQISSAVQGNVNLIQQGSCTLIQSTSGGGSSTGGNLTLLDAGNVTVTGPAGSSLSNTPLTKSNNSYTLTNTEGFSIPGQTNFTLPAGSYTINGAGGNDIGAFSANITIGSPLVVTGGLPASVTRSAGLTLNWTGGNASDEVEIIGGTSTVSGTGTSAVTTTTEFLCLTTAGQRTFTVPASILNQVPATVAATDSGFLEVATGVSNSFSAPLKAGGTIDFGIINSFVGAGAAPKYQ